MQNKSGEMELIMKKLMVFLLCAALFFQSSIGVYAEEISSTIEEITENQQIEAAEENELEEDQTEDINQSLGEPESEEELAEEAIIEEKQNSKEKDSGEIAVLEEQKESKTKINLNLMEEGKPEDDITIDEEDPQYGRAMGLIDEGFFGIHALSDEESGYVHNERFEGYTINNVIDVSKYQGDIDWEAVKASGIDYAIIRAGFRGYGETASLNTDTYFETNIKSAIAAGLEVGVYFFSQAINEEEAVEEAKYILDLIDEYDVTLPVAIDFEYASSSDGLIGRLYNANLTKEAATKICLEFCSTIESSGYTAMVYANESMLENGLNASEIAKDYKLWLANYAKSASYEGDYDFWQYTQNGTVEGISGSVDKSFWYVENIDKECTDSAIGSNCPSGNFSDIDLAAWYHLDVDYVVSKGLMVGTGDQVFGAATSTTRAMIVAILYRMSGETVEAKAIEQCKFEDVLWNQYYADAVAWAASKGIVAGVSDTEFAPDKEITREQMIALLRRYAGYKGYRTSQRSDLSGFADKSSVSDWALEDMKWGCAIDLISGSAQNGAVYLKPQGKTSRVEAAAFIHRFCGYDRIMEINIRNCEIKKDGEAYSLSFEVRGAHEGSKDNQYYIVQMESYANELTEEFTPVTFLKEQDLSGKTIKISGSKDDMKNLLMNKYAVAVLDANGKYQVLCDPVLISNPEILAANKAEYINMVSKKGLQGVGFDAAADTNSKHTLFNLDLAEVVGSGPAEGYVEYQYKGKTYYFSDCSNLIGEFRALDQGYDQYVQGKTEEKTKVAVSLCLLLSYNSENSYLIDPAARTTGHRYYMLNVREQKARETLEAVFLYLGEIFGQTDCYVTNWILGNEVNSSRAYNYSGSLNFDTYMECYATAFRLLYNGVKAQKTANNVYISLDNGWTVAPDTYTGKTTLDTFAEKIYVIDPNVEWNVSYHGYSHPLTRNDFWNDTSNTTFDLSTRYISMKNISVLTDYVAALEKKYNKESDSIRVILSEQGYNASNRDDVKAESQARALARGYYMAEFNDRVDAFIIRAIIDDEEEMKGGLFFGLKNWQDIKRITFYTYEFMDSSLEIFGEKLPNQIAGSPANQEKVKIAQEILCGSNWESMIPGFSRSKLAEMK